MKQLNVGSTNTELNDYCHFLRGYSFKQKKIFKEAEQEFERVSRPFDFYNNITMILGEIAFAQGEVRKAIAIFIKRAQNIF